MTDFLKNVIKDVGNEYASLVIDGVEAGDVDSFIDMIEDNKQFYYDTYKENLLYGEKH